MKGSINKANELKEKYSNHFIPGQFTNNDNCNAHYKTTVNEIINDTGGKIDYLVACIGTGGTITGVLYYLYNIVDLIRDIAEKTGINSTSKGYGPKDCCNYFENEFSFGKKINC